MESLHKADCLGLATKLLIQLRENQRCPDGVEIDAGGRSLRNREQHRQCPGDVLSHELIGQSLRARYDLLEAGHCTRDALQSYIRGAQEKVVAEIPRVTC